MKEKLNETSFETDIQQIYNGFKVYIKFISR